MLVVEHIKLWCFLTKFFLSENNENGVLSSVERVKNLIPIPGSSKYVRFVPFHQKNVQKGRIFTHLEDSGISNINISMKIPSWNGRDSAETPSWEKCDFSNIIGFRSLAADFKGNVYIISFGWYVNLCCVLTTWLV